MPSEWIQALAGGALIGVAALLPLIFLGRIAGISGITFGALTERGGEQRWRLSFLAGLFLGGIVLQATHPAVFKAPALSAPLLLLAGVIVGFGVILGNGCTSGHGVCGVSRLSPRSLVATLTFLLLGMLSASFFHGGNLL